MITDISGKSLLDRVLLRFEDAVGEPQILAIPDTSENDPLEEIASARNWDVFRGSEHDVLSRYAGAIRKFGVTKFIRATGDNPFTDQECVRQVIKALDNKVCARGISYPKGIAVAGAHADALLQANDETEDPYDREHVMPFIFSRPDRFSCQEIMCNVPNIGHYRLTVDTSDDVARARMIISELGDNPNLAEIVALIDEKGIEPDHGA